MGTELSKTTAAIEQGITDGLHLGAQVYVSVDGKTIADTGVGESKSGTPMTTDQMIIWFSMTKPTVAVSTAQLWERGQIELDDPVARYVPEFAANGKDRITIRHLLTHTGGLRAGDQATSESKDPDEWWAEVVAGICAVEPEDGWEPGKKAGYHLTCGMTMLGEIIRRVDGRPFNEYVRREVFEPLGMTDCWVGMPIENAKAYAEAGRLGTMHNTSTEAGVVPLAMLDHPAGLTRCSPGGGGRGPMNQLARLYEALLFRGELEGQRILLPQTVEAMTARHRVGLHDETFGVVMDWGLGFNIDGGSMGPHCSPRAFGHGGAQSSLAFCDPENGVVSVIQTNGMPGNEKHYPRFFAISKALYEDLGIASADDPGRAKQLPAMAGMATA